MFSVVKFVKFAMASGFLNTVGKTFFFLDYKGFLYQFIFALVFKKQTSDPHEASFLILFFVQDVD